MADAPSRRPRLLITLGDPCGIGPELLAVSLAALCRWADVVVVGAEAGVDLLEPVFPKRVQWRWGEPPFPAPKGWKGEAHGLWTTSRPAWDQPQSQGSALWLDPTPDLEPSHLQLGRGSAASGRAAFEAVREGARLVMEGFADALVTLPLSKASVHAAGHAIPGHTEFLQRLSGSPITRMAFVSPSLSVVLHTVHESLRSMLEKLDPEAVAETLAFAAGCFIQLTGKPDLRVALCALNPHAGENGAFGNEEARLEKARAIAEASFRGLDLSHPASGIGAISGIRHPASKAAPRFSGPLPADSLFRRAVQGEFDLVVALYHDQGLIPMKVLEPARAVNLTLGLPFIRTSPDHGTAFDKAGRWVADPANFLEAAALAVRLAGRAKGTGWTAEVRPGV